MNKLIYLCYTPLTKKFQDDLYLLDIKGLGIEVEYWDITRLYGEKVSIKDEVRAPYVFQINDYGTLEKRLINESREDGVFIPQIYYEKMTLKVYSLLSKYNCTTHYYARGYMPWARPGKSWLRKVADPARLYAYIIRKLGPAAGKTLGIKPYDTVFAAGNIARKAFGARSRVININHHDYDDYLAKKNVITPKTASKYCVFIDDGLPDHPDFKIIGNIMMERGYYYTALSNYLRAIEDKFGIKALIAAHPKAEHMHDYYPANKIIHSRTAELVQNCEFAVAHMSTAISYAVLFEKPIVFIYMNEFKRASYRRIYDNIEAIAGYLGYRVNNADNMELPASNNVNADRYRAYKYDYLTSPESEGRQTRNIITNYYKELKAI